MKSNTNKERTSIIVSLWLSATIIFGVIVCFCLDQSKALEFFTRHLVEYSLSIDKMVVFLMIFSFFKIPRQNQSKVFTYGTVGAIIFRFLFVFIGINLISSFSWMIYIFGVI